MPRLDGLAAAARLKRSPTDRRDIPIVMVTAAGAADRPPARLGSGVDAYLTKPFDPASDPGRPVWSTRAGRVRKLRGQPAR